jgi:hypothetical protein
MYQKLIDNAKHTISSTLIQSKVLANSFLLTNNSNNSITSLTANNDTIKRSSLNVNSAVNQSFPAQLKVSHKQLSLKQV